MSTRPGFARIFGFETESEIRKRAPDTGDSDMLGMLCAGTQRRRSSFPAIGHLATTYVNRRDFTHGRRRSSPHHPSSRHRR